ncbi:MAG TPA: hypothetical protein VIY29_06730 [Ktedonobacteraceae bacterium]
MPTQNEMTVDERRKYVKLMSERYQKAKRKERSELLSEMEQVSQLHRKHLIRLLNGESLQRKKRSTARSRTYGLEVERVVLRVWESLDYICAERLTPSLGRTAKHLARFGALVLTAEVESQLATISCATVERMLRKNRARKERLPRSGPHRANQVRHRGADGAHSLGHERARPLRDGFSASWGRECSRGVWAHPATDRRSHWTPVSA